MGEKSRRKDQRGEGRGRSSSMSEEDRAAFRAKRQQPEQDSSDGQRLDLNASEAGNGSTSSGHTMAMADFKTLSKEERQALKEAVATETDALRMGAFTIIKKLSRFALPQWRAIGFGFLLLMLQGLMDVAKPLPLAYSIDTVVKQQSLGGSALYLLLFAGSVVILISFFEGLFSYLKVLVVNRAVRTMTRNIRATMFDHVQRLSLQYHNQRRSGDLLLRMSGDIRSIQTIFTSVTPELLSNLIFLVGMASIMVFMDWQIGLAAICLATPLFFYVKRYANVVRTYTTAQRRREGEVSSIFHDALGATRLTRVFNREKSMRDKFEEESAIALELGLLASLRDSRFGWSVDVFGSVITAVVFIFATYKAQQGLISEGELFLFFFYARSFYRPIRTGIKNWNAAWRSLAQAERVVELLDMEHGVADQKDAKPAPAFQGEIEFKDVSFSFNAETPLMAGVSFTIPARRVTAVVGPTGAGKTTLVSMVARLYDPETGSVSIDGRDIREYTVASLRDQVSVVLQESNLLYSSIAENIAYGKDDADQGEIEMAAWLAGAHEFIRELPDGYQTIIGERGETLSGGQRQQIAIARAIIRDAPIVILDEPMTGLDPSSALQVREALERLIANKTVLFITHNLALVEAADNVLVVDQGTVVQQGTPTALRRQDGLYRQLFSAQAEAEGVLADLLTRDEQGRSPST